MESVPISHSILEGRNLLHTSLPCVRFESIAKCPMKYGVLENKCSFLANTAYVDIDEIERQGWLSVISLGLKHQQTELLKQCEKCPYEKESEE